MDWFDSTIIDIAFWHYYLSGAKNKRIKEKHWKVAEEIYKNYPLSKDLGFSVFHKEQYGKKVINSLQEFKNQKP